jgi:hypothetical protein
MVEIVPHFSFQEVHFLSGTYGPFQVYTMPCTYLSTCALRHLKTPQGPSAQPRTL